MSATLLAFSNQHRVGLGLDGLPGRASARRTGGKRALTLVIRSGGSFQWVGGPRTFPLMLVNIGH
jgi:hypothetical protein